VTRNGIKRPDRAGSGADAEERARQQSGSGQGHQPRHRLDEDEHSPGHARYLAWQRPAAAAGIVGSAAACQCTSRMVSGYR
jgi:hypothetical protein